VLGRLFKLIGLRCYGATRRGVRCSRKGSLNSNILGFAVTFCKTHAKIKPHTYYYPWAFRFNDFCIHPRDLWLMSRIYLFAVTFPKMLEHGYDGWAKKIKDIFEKVRNDRRMIAECPVCLEDVSTISMACGHRVCINCIHKICIMDSNYCFKCPMCATFII